MTGTDGLIKTLDFQLDIQSDNQSLLNDATIEARRVYNKTIRLAKEGTDWDPISTRLEDDSDLVKNTTQRIVVKALGAMENYYEYDDYGKPSHTKDSTYPLRANFTEGYNLSLTDDGDVAFRISAKPYNHVKGILEGSDAHLNLLKTALTSDEWKVSTSETLWCNGEPELHVNVTNTEQTVRDKQNSRTVVGVDVNEDNVALTALSEDGVEDSLVIDFPEIKFERHRYFTIRKRVQNAGEGQHPRHAGRA
jgi:transposase